MKLLSLIFAVCIGGCVQPNDDAPTAVPPHHTGAGRVFDKNGFSIQPPEGYSNIGRSAFHFMNFVGPSDDGNLLAYSIDNTGFRQYKLQVKDLRTGVQTSDTAGVLDGDLDEFMAATLAQRAFGTGPGQVEDVE